MTHNEYTLVYLTKGAAAPLAGGGVRVLQQLHGIVHGCGWRKIVGMKKQGD